MARLFVLVVVLAAVIPTAVLGASGGGFTSRPLTIYSVHQVQRAFAAEGLALSNRHTRQPTWEANLVRRGRGQPRLSVTVLVPRRLPKPKSGGTALVAVFSGYNALNSAPRYFLFAFAGNGDVTVSWSTNHAWRSQAAHVYAALERLPLLGPGRPQISCYELSAELKLTKAELKAETNGLPFAPLGPGPTSCGNYP